MKILFDANTPATLAKSLRGHKVSLAVQMGWDRLENGTLLTVAEDDAFDVVVTCDQNLTHQQNLKGRKIAVVVLSTNHWPRMRPVASRIANLIDFAQSGQITRIDVSMLSRKGASNPPT
ncbi:MAG: hypothetical protein HYZ37_14185 [Candidatus Solibacter usitatus]|nr:hypothetical protein [Candidatus Solibacter usitatus]